MAEGKAMRMASGVEMGNAPLTYHEPKKTKGNGADPACDAVAGPGVGSGCYMKETIKGADVALLGKPIHDMGTPPWDGPQTETVGAPVGPGEFGTGTRHVIRNG